MIFRLSWIYFSSKNYVGFKCSFCVCLSNVVADIVSVSLESVNIFY